MTHCGVYGDLALAPALHLGRGLSDLGGEFVELKTEPRNGDPLSVDGRDSLVGFLDERCLRQSALGFWSYRI